MYAGGLITILSYGLWWRILPPHITVSVGLALLVPGGIDGTTQMFGGRESTNSLRALTGFLLGVGVVLMANGVVITLITLA